MTVLPYELIISQKAASPETYELRSGGNNLPIEHLSVTVLNNVSAAFCHSNFQGWLTELKVGTLI